MKVTLTETLIRPEFSNKLRMVIEVNDWNVVNTEGQPRLLVGKDQYDTIEALLSELQTVLSAHLKDNVCITLTILGKVKPE